MALRLVNGRLVDEKRYTDRKPRYQDYRNDYILPNDIQEHERLRSQHKAYIAAGGGRTLHIPFINNPQKIVDIGCGTGIVTRELSDSYPNAAHVYGVDLSKVPADPTNPDGDLQRRNLEFIQGDVRKLAGTDARLQPGTFDICYSKLLILGVTDWVGFARHKFNLLKPGGWAQFTEPRNDISFDPAISTRSPGFVAENEWGWLKAAREGGRKMGFDVDAGENLAGYLEAAGFVDIHQHKFMLPYWRGAADNDPKYRMAAEHHIGDPYGLWWVQVARQAEVLGYSRDQIRQWQWDSKRDLAEEPGKLTWVYVTVGRKPEAASS